MAISGAVSGFGSSIDSILLCASRSPDMRFDIDRFGVGLRSFSSACAPSELLELFFAKLGEEEVLSLRLIALDALLTVLDGFGECCVKGEVAGCEGRRTVEVCKFGVAGVEDKGVLKVLLGRLSKTICVTV